MRKIVHLSDLHFCHTDPVVLPALRDTIYNVRPDIVVVSGDLTQRARDREFAAARAWLETLAFPRLVVPGNHDVPLYNIFKRAFSPLAGYQKYFGDDLAPFHGDGEIAVAGVNTARSLTIKGGRINHRQAIETCRRLSGAGEGALRIIVTHHPFEPGHEHDEDPVGRAAMAMREFAGCGVDLILSGHLHASHARPSAERYDLPGYSALLVHAGTATSVRRRGEPNSFNIVDVDGPAVAVGHWIWHDALGRFIPGERQRFAKSDGGWRALSDTASP